MEAALRGTDLREIPGMRNQGNRSGGFTLIELMIVIAIIAIIAAIALPNLVSSRISANETATIATLRTFTSAQAQFQQAAYADVDNDGVGEYGCLGELSASVNVRGRGTPIRPATLSGGFSAINANGQAVRNGYLYRLFLPDAGGLGLGELAGGGADAGVDADLSEATWCCYAWPAQFESSGVRTFFVNQNGDILATEDSSYTGPATTIVAGAAFRVGGNADSVTGPVANALTGRDGNFWKGVR